ncbi:MAG: monovalent cation/H(+) antiporter subunit G [Dehalococcoidales bacterium]
MVGTVIAIVLIAAGVFFLMVSALGLLRLPDFYARTHAVGKSETLGSILVLSGLAVYNGWELGTVKILFILFFVLIASPTATHAIARAALRTGRQPWIRQKTEQKAKEVEPS